MLIRNLFIGFCLLIGICSCNIYSHSGASVPADATTFSVAYMVNNASIVAPTLSQELTEKLKTKCINESGLKLTNAVGDFHFSGKITDYKTAPSGIQGNQTTAVNRLSVSVEVVFENRLDSSKNFTQVFSNFVDFDAQQDFASIEQSLIGKITDGLIQDVFNKAFINW
jgi:hypothetical protein